MDVKFVVCASNMLPEEPMNGYLYFVIDDISSGTVVMYLDYNNKRFKLSAE